MGIKVLVMSFSEMPILDEHFLRICNAVKHTLFEKHTKYITRIFDYI